jgi:hypothetical protein
VNPLAAFTLFAYGVLTGYQVHRKGIDRKIAAAIRTGYSEVQRTNVRIFLEECDLHASPAVHAGMPPE